MVITERVIISFRVPSTGAEMFGNYNKRNSGKSIISLIVWATITFSCSRTLPPGGSKPTEQGTITLHEGKGYTNFKNEVFICCLKKVYPEKFSLMLDSLDGSHNANLDQVNYDPHLIQLADSLPETFTKRNEATWSIENRKVTLNVCLSYRNSIELDRFAVGLFGEINERKNR